MRTKLLALAAVACACAPEPQYAPPPPRILSAQEAVDVAARFARSRGLAIERTLAAHLDRRARWHVDLAGAGGRDRALVVLDGYSGRVLRARLRDARGEHPPQPSPPAPTGPPPPGASPAPPPSASPAPPPGGAPQAGPTAPEEPDGELPPVPPPEPPPQPQPPSKP